LLHKDLKRQDESASALICGIEQRQMLAVSNARHVHSKAYVVGLFRERRRKNEQ
jgi:hypothetical protein